MAVSLAASLASKLDRASQTASANAREPIRTVTDENLEEAVDDAVVAHVDRRGGRGSAKRRSAPC